MRLLFSASVLYPIRAAAPHFGQTAITFDTCVGAGRLIISPFCPCFFGLRCFFLTLTPSAKMRSSSEKILITLPVFPRSFPEITLMGSGFFMFIAHLGEYGQE